MGFEMSSSLVACGFIVLAKWERVDAMGSRVDSIVRASVWNALYVRFPVEKDFTLQHCASHVVLLTTKASYYRRIKKSHANGECNDRRPFKS